MYKPHTIEQYKIQRFLDDTFAMEHFLVSPLSRTSLLLEDETGEQLAFSFLDDEVREIPLPPPDGRTAWCDVLRRMSVCSECRARQEDTARHLSGVGASKVMFVPLLAAGTWLRPDSSTPASMEFVLFGQDAKRPGTWGYVIP